MPSGRTNNFPESGRGLVHVTTRIFGSTVGYPSESFWLLVSDSQCSFSFVWHCMVAQSFEQLIGLVYQNLLNADNCEQGDWEVGTR